MQFSEKWKHFPEKDIPATLFYMLFNAGTGLGVVARVVMIFGEKEHPHMRIYSLNDLEYKLYGKQLYMLWFFALVILIGLPGQLPGQSDPDSGYKKAHRLAQQGHDGEARAVCYDLLKKNASDIEALLLLGRLYSWDHQYDSARIILQRAMMRQPENEKILKAVVNNEIWSGNPDKALEYSNRGINQHPQSDALLVLKAKAFAAKKEYAEALHASEAALHLNPHNTEALRLQENLKKEMRRNVVGLYTDYDKFDRNYSSWNFLSFYYMRKTAMGPVVATVNYANRFSVSGYQYTLDFYPRLNRKTFLYLSTSYSGSAVFPQTRLGISVTRLLPRNVDAEVGFRYFSFQGTDPSLLVWTGSLEKHLHHFLFGFRAFAGPESGGLFQFYQIRSRYYLTNTDNYFTLTMGTGNSPDNQLDPVLLQYRTVTSRVMNADIHFLAGKQYFARLGLGYEKRINSPETFENRVTIGVGLEKTF
ncbi:MAG: YaiO family outer membrane beta-barrel protein [Bacteroidia bacterium]